MDHQDCFKTTKYVCHSTYFLRHKIEFNDDKNNMAPETL